MRLESFEAGGLTIAELIQGSIASERDATDLVGNASFQGADVVLVAAELLPEEFFDLSTGLAGAVLQKFSNYRLRLTIIGTFEERGSDSLQAFIRESNRGGLVTFAPGREEWLAGLGE